jgi:hypothetical protein
MFLRSATECLSLSGGGAAIWARITGRAGLLDKWQMDKFAEDWIGLWQSELTAMAADRELRESITAMLALWASTATGAMSLLEPHDPGRDAKTVEPPRPPAATAASEPGLDEVTSLYRRIAALEQRLAGLEPAGRPDGLEPAGRPDGRAPAGRPDGDP